MEEYFGIRYCFEKDEVHKQIDNLISESKKGYICVADGVTLSMSYRNKKLKEVLSNSAITICDSGWVPIYLKSIYGIKREQYSGSDFLMDIVNQKKHKLYFLGTSNDVLLALKNKLVEKDPNLSQAEYQELPFMDVSEFDYKQIAKQINEANPDIIFVSLGMPKQEFFMYNLIPHINRGVMAGVGAAFKFHSGLSNQKRAPKWMIKAKIEWVHRIFSEPKKQIKRCSLIFATMPFVFLQEMKKKNKITA